MAPYNPKSFIRFLKIKKAVPKNQKERRSGLSAVAVDSREFLSIVFQ